MRYYGGERVTTSGVYRSVHMFHREHDAEQVFLSGQSFPNCSLSQHECSDVEYILLRAALSVEEIEDFQTILKAKRKPSSAA